MKIGLSLGGGGALGYAHIGAIRAFEEAGVPIDLINGASMGAVIGGAYALYGDTGKITALVGQVLRSIDVRRFNIFRYREDMRPFLRNWLVNAVCDVSVIRASILSHTTDLKALRIIFGDREFRDTRIPFSSVAVDLITGEIVVIDSGKLVEGILPSISIPGIFPPVERDGRLLIDGGVLTDVPARELRAWGADFVIAIRLGPKIGPERDNGFDILNAVEYIKEDALTRWELEHSDFHCTISIPDLNILEFDGHEKAIARGYDAARKALPELKRRLSQAHA